MIREEFTEVITGTKLDDCDCDCTSAQHTDLLWQDTCARKGINYGVWHSFELGEKPQLFFGNADSKNWIHLYEEHHWFGLEKCSG